MKRTFEERRDIVAAMVASRATKSLTDYDLTKSELIFYRARADQAIEATAKRASAFREFYELPTSKPFRGVILLVTLVIATPVALLLNATFAGRLDDPNAYPLIGTCLTVIAASIGWCVGSGISHRNTVRQNTQNLIFSRFAQTAHTDALHSFHRTFGYTLDEKVHPTDIAMARDGGEEPRRGAEAVNYLLNYFEFISAGVLCGDLDEGIIKQNIRGIIVYYYDKCEPYIYLSNKKNPKAFAALIKVRTSYRMP